MQTTTARGIPVQSTEPVAPLPVSGNVSAAEAAKPVTAAIAATAVAPAIPQSARTVVQAARQPAVATDVSVDTDPASENSTTRVAAIAAGEANTRTQASIFGSKTAKSDTAGNGSLANNPQLLAQAVASAGVDSSTQALDIQLTKSSPALQALPETPTVTQNFNTEMRAALDAPTQAAAYTAKGAVTAQPAAQQVALQISSAANQGSDKLTVHLKPAELGKITIDLEVGPDNRLTAVIAADKSDTLDLLQRDARQLERALNDAGLKTDSGSLEFNLRGDGGSADSNTDGGGKLADGAVMLPGTSDDLYDHAPHARTPLIMPEGRIDIQV